MRKSRILARTIDYSVFYTLLIAFGFPSIVNLILLCLIPLCFAPIEGILYYFFKTTPGKWLCGISLSKKLPFFSSLKLAFKKSLLILPLFFSPLNLLFIFFYLRESKEHRHKRWDIFESSEIITKRSKKGLKNTLLILLILGMSISYIPSSIKADFISLTKNEVNLENWVEVKDSNLNFSVYFPSKPKVVKKEVDVEEKNTKLNVTEYTHQDNVSYSLVSSKIPSSWTILGSKYLFKALSKPMEKHQGKISSKEFIQHGKHPSMNYLLENKTGGQTKGALILVKKTIYKLEVTGKKNLTQKELDIASEFIASFDVN